MASLSDLVKPYNFGAALRADGQEPPKSLREALLSDRYQRGAVLPLVRDTMTGETQWGLPEILATPLRGAMLPGDVYSGRTQVFGPDGRVSQDVVERGADLAGSMTLGAAVMPAQRNAVGMGIRARNAPQSAADNLPVRASSDDVWEVIQSNFEYGDLVGNRTLPIAKLRPSGTGEMADQRPRIERLMASMSGPEGYISRLIVDDDGNIIEGQHRYEALKNMGATRVPVTVVRDKAKGRNIQDLRAAVLSGGQIRSDNVNQVIDHALDMVAQSGSPQAALQEWELPRQFENNFRALLQHMAKSR